MSDFKKLQVWQRAHALSLSVHRAALEIRGGQYTALKSQMIRAAMSVAANIVEGRGQRSAAEFARYLRISLNSAAELEYHLITARDYRAVAISILLLTPANDENSERHPN